MYTRWRLYILAVFLIVIGVLLFACRIWRKRGHSFSALREVFLILGVVLIVETLIVSTLSNYNLGVILPAFFGVPLVFLALLLPKMQKGVLLFLKWLIAACYAVAIGIFLVCGFFMIRAASEGEHVEADAIIVHHGLGSGRTKGAQAIEVILWTKPSALEGTHVRWIRHAWAVHNLVGHPLMQILVWLGFRKAAFAVHDGTVPGRDGLVT